MCRVLQEYGQVCMLGQRTLCRTWILCAFKYACSTEEYIERMIDVML